MSGDLLDRILGPDPPPFAVVHRPDTAPHAAEVLTGPVHRLDRLADLPVPERTNGPVGHDLLVVVPYRQLAERGFACPDDGSPLLAMTVEQQQSVSLDELRRRIPDTPFAVRGGEFDLSDADYADLVRRVLHGEISSGQGANFVLKRTYHAKIENYFPAAALTLFRRLLTGESGAYWTFVVHTGDRTFVGASPERHISLSDGTAVMNPISGTYRYPSGGPTLDGVLRFLGEQKETDELSMVVDEELKMMSRICDGGCRLIGPFLKEMTRLAHTEYLIEGRTTRDVREILLETLFAPTVTGSPLESATRVINRYEPGGRGYYSGVLALIGRDGHGGRALDSAILIRTADVDRAGRVGVTVGATLVRHSDPAGEAAETRAKAAGLIAALGASPQHRFADDPEVRRALAARNSAMAPFWFTGGERSAYGDPGLAGRRVLVVDAEDTFTWMIGDQLRALGLHMTVRRYDEPCNLDGHDLVVMGPGPGDPRDRADPKIAALRSTIGHLLEAHRPLLAVCLSHQVLCDLLGLPLVRLDPPNQGTQREIDLFGLTVRAGFYNSFAARWSPETPLPGRYGPVQIARQTGTGEVYALRGDRFRSIQFHAESILTRDGIDILRSLVAPLVHSAEREATLR